MQITKCLLVSGLALALSPWIVGTTHAQAPAQQAAPPPAAAPATPAEQPPPEQYAPPPQQYAPPPAGYPTGPIYSQPQPVYGQPYPGTYPQPRPPKPRRPHKGLMISGIAVFGGSYLVTAITGAVVMDIPRTSCIDCKDVGPMLLIPMVGPFLAIPKSVGEDGIYVFLGIVQTAGLGMMVGGIVWYVLSKREIEREGAYSLDLPKGRQLSFNVDTSPARFGPSMRLRF